MTFGYDPEAPMDKVITAFQRHFRPRQMTGIWDEDCGALLAALLAKRAISTL
jgi:N-acetyl-anhydromuramyl-L-alanine amidase AmpD